METIKAFFNWLFSTALFSPIFEKIGDTLDVPGNIIKIYGVQGIIHYWWKYLLIIVLVVGVVKIIRLFGWLNPGNLPKYNPGTLKKDNSSPLKGKTLYFLGSSVTKGFAAYGKSFADMIAAQTEAVCTKNAVSGTRLVDRGKANYIQRLHEIPGNTPMDAFICQLSTNDARFKSPLGSISDRRDLKSFDVSTVAGAIEHIIVYAREMWNCPIVFYSNPRYRNQHYADMVKIMRQAAKKWDIPLIDLWDNKTASVENISHTFRNDAIHPTKKGYRTWLPIFTSVLSSVIAGTTLPVFEPVGAPEQKTLKKKQSHRRIRHIIGTIVVVIVAIAIWMGACGFQEANNVLGLTDPFNSDKYAPQNVPALENSPIEGKTILWLGSSVFEGFGARKISMADYIRVRDKVITVKDCYSGTYLATTTQNDYLPRILKHDKTTDPVVDLVIVQLSTNDSRQLTELGEPAPADIFDLDKLDQKTTCGALEYIVGYTRQTWNCPVLVYASLPWEQPSDEVGLQNPRVYEKIVEKTRVICDKWGSYVLDMWNDKDRYMEGIDAQLYDDYMTDGTHCTRYGYLNWWTPFFEEKIYEILK